MQRSIYCASFELFCSIFWISHYLCLEIKHGDTNSHNQEKRSSRLKIKVNLGVLLLKLTTAKFQLKRKVLCVQFVMLLLSLQWDYGIVKLKEFLFRGVVFGWSSTVG